jgi:hypothetical protein
MLGELASGDAKLTKHSGLIPRIFDHLLAEMQRRAKEQSHDNSSIKYECHVSMLEIYNETITDLLQPEATNLQIREDAVQGIHVESLSQRQVFAGMGHPQKSVTSTSMRLCVH